MLRKLIATGTNQTGRGGTIMVKRTAIAGLGGLVIGAVLWFGQASAQNPSIVLSIDPSSQTLTATLDAGTQQIAGTQNDISFATSAPIAAKSTGKPNCVANADVGLNGTSFAFEPPGCSASAGTCTSVRAIAFATDSTSPIPDGSVLYTCTTTGATADSVFGCTGQVGSNPSGISFNGTAKVCSGDGVTGCTSDSDCTTATTPPTPAPGGLCSIVLPQLGCQGLPASVVPTNTPVAVPPTSTPVPVVPTATPAGPSGPTIVLSIDPSSQTLTATLDAGTQQIAGTQNDISFATSAPIAAKSTGKPNCVANADVGLNGTSFAFEPPGCSASAGTCTSVRAIAFATDSTSPIPDGSVLYTCTTTGATADSVFGCTGQVGSNPSGISFNGTAKVCSGDGVTGCTSDSDCTTATTPPTPAPGGLCSIVLPQLGCQGLPASVVPTNTPVAVAPTNTPVAVAPTNTPVVVAPTNTPVVATATSVAATSTPVAATSTPVAATPTHAAATNTPGGATPTPPAATSTVVAATNTPTLTATPLVFTALVISAPAGATSLTVTTAAAADVLPTSGIITFINTGTSVGSGPVNIPFSRIGATLTLTGGATLPIAIATGGSVDIIAAQPAFQEDTDGCQIGTAGSNGSAWLLLIPLAGLVTMRRKRR
jgi:hypothetical protein